MFISTSAFTPAEITAAILREPLVVSPDTTVMAAIAQMSGVRSLSHANKTAEEQLEQLNLEIRSSCVLVVEAGKPIGILTERDIVRLSADRQPLDRLLMQQVMAHPIITLRESAFTDLFSTIHLLQQHQIRHLPIVDDQNHLVGIVTHESLRQTFGPIDLLRSQLAADVMTREVICATADRPILEIVQLMAQNQVSSVIVVVEPQERPEPLQIPVGIITERDIVKFQALGLDLESCQAKAVMSTPLFTIKPEDSLGCVQELMNQHLIGRLPVTGKQGELLGIVTQTTLLQALNPLELYKLAETLAAKVVKLKADQIALLENHNIELEKQVESRTTALQAKAQQQKLIADIAIQIRSSLSLQTILDTAVKEVQQVLECDHVNIWQLTADGQITAVAESTNSSRSLLGEKIKDLCFSQKDCIEIYRQGYIHVVPDIYTTNISDCHRQLLIRLETRAKILVPIVCGDQLWGLLNASESQHPRDWQQLEIELLQLLSIQIAIAIQQATTYQKLQDELAIRKRIEVTLKDSEERYAALAAAAPVGIFCTDTRGQCIYINDRYSQITGLTAELARSKGWQQGLHPEDRDWVLAKWENFVQNQDPFEFEYRFQSPDGKVTWVYGQSVPERDGFGQLIGYVGTITNISDRKRTESALQQSEERYATLVEAAPVGIFRTDILGNCIYVNDRWCLMSGLTAKSALGSGWRAGLHPDDRDAIVTEWYESAQENRPFQLEYRFQSPDGKVTWVYGQSVSELDGEGQIVGYVGTITDISDHKQSEEALAKSAAHQQALISAIPDFMFCLSADGIYEEFITGNREINFLPADFDPTGLAIADVLPPAIATRYLYYLKQALNTGELQIYEQQIQIGDRLQDEEVRVVKNGEAECLFMIRDISARKQAERMLQEFNQQLENKVRERTQELSAFKLALDQSAIVVITDPQGVITYANDRFCEISGYSRNELLGQTHSVVNSNYHSAEFFQELWQTISRGEIWRGEICNRTKSHHRYWEQSTIVPFLDTQGQPFQYLAIRFDITARKLAEAANLQENTFRRQIVENITEGLCVFHVVEEFPLLHFTVWNQQMQEITGYSLKEISRLGWYQSLLTELEMQTQAIARITRMQQGENLMAEEWEIQRQDGQRRTVSISTSILSVNDKRIYILALIQDITERKHTELENLLLKERLEFMLSSSPAMIYSCKPFGDYAATFMSKNIEAILGYKPEQFLSEAGFWANHIHPDDTSRVFGELSHLFEYDTHQHEYRFLHGEGHYIWLRDELRLIRDQQGKPAEIVGYFADISERKKAEQIIKKQAERETLLREITQRIRQSLDLQTIFETATQEIRRFLETERVSIFKFYPESNFNDGEFVAESVAPEFISVLKIRVHDHCFAENFSLLYQQGRIQITNDIKNANLLDCHQAILSQFQVRANLILPLLNGSLLWGLLCIHQCSDRRDWQEAEINFVQEIANQLAIAIQQASLYEQVQSELVIRKQAERSIALQLQRQKTLGEIAQQIRESLDINQILATVTQQVKEILLSDRVIVFRLFDCGKSQIIEEAVSSQFTALKNRSWDDEVWDQEILNYYSQGQPRIVADVMNDVWTNCLVQYSIEGNIKSKIVAPILQEVRTKENDRWIAPNQSNKLWGVLVVHSCRTQRIWQESEAQLLQQIANNLGIAIQQADLFEQLQQELNERQQTQQQLTERNLQLGISNEELARATRLKDEFLANMSHELRTPLNAILGMTEGLQDQVFGVINEEQLKALQTIEKSGGHLLALINDILDVAKIESGQIKLDLNAVSIDSLCQSSLTFIKQQALQKRIQLEIKQALNLPNLLIDERRIRQVLINLLNNAVKFTPNGGKITLEVSHPCNGKAEAETLLSENYVQIAVIDTGIGISPKDIKKLFQPFIQIDSDLNRQYQGTGLGLALVKRIVELHRGQVELTSEVGQGSCFTIKLPCVTTVSTFPKLTESSLSTRETNQSNQSNSPLILLAEDNEANIITVSSYLGAKGYRILNAKNGQEAIEFAKLHPPNLILMDIQMPGMDGLEAMREIRRDPQLVDVPIIALTALAMSGDRERCLEAGANDYLTKPVKLKQLTANIQKFLGG